MPGVDIRKDDTVRVMAGKDRGKEGRVVRVLPREGRVMVDGVALAKKHQRATGRASGSSQAIQQGGIIDVEMFIDISNVQPVCAQLRQAHAHRAPRRGRRHEGPHLPEVRGGAMSDEATHRRMKQRFRDEVVPALQERARARRT